jgi:hypothetical protein
MHQRESRVDADAEALLWSEQGEYDTDAEIDFPLAEAVHNDPLEFADEPIRKLALALDFGPEDLAFNREGQLSADQIARLDQDLRYFYGGIAGTLAAVAILLAFMGMVAGELLLFPILLSLILTVIPATLFRLERERLPDRRVQRTTMRLGTLSLVARRWGLSDDNTLPVPGGKPIFAPKPLYKALQANRGYILYYTPMRTLRGYRLLTLEPVEEGFMDEKPKRKLKRG